MKLKTRLTHDFVEIKVDEIETTIFKNGNEAMETIDNLLEAIDDLCRLSGKEFKFEIKEK